MEAFYKKITEWLLPKGYKEVYSNHPLTKDREFHFSKNGIRVICVMSTEEYCYVYKDIMKHPYNLGLKTGRFKIGTNQLDEIYDFVKENSALLK